MPEPDSVVAVSRLRISRAPAALVVAFALAALAVGCGSDDDETEIRTVVERYVDAVDDRDAAVICGELLLPSTVERVGGREVCERHYFDAEGAADLDPDEVEITSIDVEGDSARVNLGGGLGYARARQEAGRWYIQVE